MAIQKSKDAQNSIAWLQPVILRFEDAFADEERFLHTLRAQLRTGISTQGWKIGDLRRCVYLIRMKGEFIVAYQKGNSPVLYVGRGGAMTRLAQHLSSWLSEVHGFGQGVDVEIRICMPRRKKREDFFKNVEADLIAEFCKRYGSVPFFNSRRETKFERKVKYNKATRELLSRSIGIGKGNRPRWAIKPTPANKNLKTYLAGTDSE